MRLTANLFAVLLLIVATVAKADSFQYMINSSVQESIMNTDNDSFMGIYSTPPDALGTQTVVHTAARYYENSPFSNISFSIPAGNVITSVELDLIFSSAPIQGTADASLGGDFTLPPPDPFGPTSTPATIGSATSSVTVEGMSNPLLTYGYIQGDSLIMNLSPQLVINGDQISSVGLEDIHLLVMGEINADIGTQGYNYQAYVGGTGQATIPYTLEVSGTYSPVPEPSSITLLSTGLLGLVGFARRKFVS